MIDERLAPPPVAVEGNLAWLLRFAFGESLEESSPPDPMQALQLARRTEISGRIAERLRRCKGLRLGVSSSEFEADYHTNLAVEALLGRALDSVSAVAARQAIPVVALKYAGLRLTGVITPGTRMAGDLDLLVSAEHAGPLWHALLDIGFSRTRTRSHSHQLEALVDPHGAVVELHLHMPGVCVVDERPATLGDLRTAGLINTAAGSLLVPNPALLGAHAVAHALVQNWATPQTYSPLRMIADIADLRSHESEVLSSAARFLTPKLGAACLALERLCVALASGMLGGSAVAGSSEQSLLWHCVAARCNEDYSDRLRASGLTQAISSGPSALGRFLAGALFPAEHELEVLNGSGKLDQIGSRWRRPFAITARAASRWSRLRSR